MREPRSTTVPSFLDLVDTISRGGTDEWRELYERAVNDLELQALIGRALPMVDPELGASRELWAYLLDTMQPTKPAEPAKARKR